MSSKYNKLVRDKIPEIIKLNGEVPIVRILDDDEYEQELIKKLNEEYQEVVNAKNKEELLEECADMLEVILALIEFNGYNLNNLLDTRNSKKEKRGAFSKKLYLSGVKK